jgi:hypothetical protein
VRTSVASTGLARQVKRLALMLLMLTRMIFSQPRAMLQKVRSATYIALVAKPVWFSLQVSPE